MSDLSRGSIDYQVQVVGTDGTVACVIEKGSVNALCVDIAGSSGSAATLSIANRLETNTISSTGSWDTVLSLTVPTGKTWYLKGLTVSASAFSKFRMSIGGTQKFYSRSDADDINEVMLHGYQVNTGVTILIEGDAGAVGKELIANLIIYEV